jgi:hypothetical protein
MNILKLNTFFLFLFVFCAKNSSADIVFNIFNPNDFEILVIERNYSYTPSRYIFQIQGYSVIFANDIATILRVNYSSWDPQYKFYGLLARKWIPKEKRWERRVIQNLKIPGSDQQVEQVDLCYPTSDHRFYLNVRDKDHVESLNISKEIDEDYIETKGKSLVCPNEYRKMTSNFRLKYLSSNNEFRKLHLRLPIISFEKLTKIPTSVENIKSQKK